MGGNRLRLHGGVVAFHARGDGAAAVRAGSGDAQCHWGGFPKSNPTTIQAGNGGLRKTFQHIRWNFGFLEHGY